MLFPFLTFMMVFIITTMLIRARNSHNEKERRKEFLEREVRANSTRKVDLDTLTYLNVDPSVFPFTMDSDQESDTFSDELRAICAKRMLNLHGVSNTDLKLQYGAANLEKLTEYDDNFTDLEKWVVAYAHFLIEKDHIPEAITTLEKGVSLGSDIAENYTLLGDLYLKSDRVTGIQSLIDMTKALNDYNRPIAVSYLESLLPKAEPSSV